MARKVKKLEDMKPKFQGEVKGFSHPTHIDEFMAIYESSKFKNNGTKQQSAVDTIQDTLNERGKRYGEFIGNATIAQKIKKAMHESKNWELLEPDQKEALEVTASKIGRILNGDFMYVDSWHDIGGFSQLVVNRLRESAK